MVEDNRDILANRRITWGGRVIPLTVRRDGLSGLHLAATEHYDLIVPTSCCRHQWLHFVQTPARRCAPRYASDHAHRPRSADDRLQASSLAPTLPAQTLCLCRNWRRGSKPCCAVHRAAVRRTLQVADLSTTRTLEVTRKGAAQAQPGRAEAVGGADAKEPARAAPRNSRRSPVGR